MAYSRIPTMLFLEKAKSAERQRRKTTGLRFLRDAHNIFSKDPEIAGLPNDRGFTIQLLYEVARYETSTDYCSMRGFVWGGSCPVDDIKTCTNRKVV